MNDITTKLSEDIHYQIIPQEGSDDNWDVRLIEDYPETVIRFGNVRLEGDGPDDEEGYISFNFEIVFTPDSQLTTEDLTFQEYCGRILNSIIEVSLMEGGVVARDDETGEFLATEEMIEELQDEYQFGTDGSQESTD